jgi:hypothetical protein
MYRSHPVAFISKRYYRIRWHVDMINRHENDKTNSEQKLNPLDGGGVRYNMRESRHVTLPRAMN